MKTCPNCGSKMDPSVNFCTNCGSDLRNVPTDEEKAQATQMTQATVPVQSTRAAQPNTPSRKEVREQYTQASQESQAQSTMPQARVANAANTANTQAAPKFDASNMWQWFVNSWKKPFQIQAVESWYGWVTLLIENILFVLGLYICINIVTSNYTSEAGEYGEQAQAIISNFSTSVLFELFLSLIIAAVAMIAAVYFVRKYVYNVNENFFDLVNRIISCSNLNAILFVAIFVCLLIGSNNMIEIAGFLFDVAIAIFCLANYAIIVADANPVNDKFYGLLIVFAVETVVIWILLKIFGNAVVNQIQDLVYYGTNGLL